MEMRSFGPAPQEENNEESLSHVSPDEAVENQERKRVEANATEFLTETRSLLQELMQAENNGNEITDEVKRGVILRKFMAEEQMNLARNEEDRAKFEKTFKLIQNYLSDDGVVEKSVAVDEKKEVMSDPYFLKEAQVLIQELLMKRKESDDEDAIGSIVMGLQAYRNMAEEQMNSAITEDERKNFEKTIKLIDNNLGA